MSSWASLILWLVGVKTPVCSNLKSLSGDTGPYSPSKPGYFSYKWIFDTSYYKNWMLVAITRLTPNMLGSREGTTEIDKSVYAYRNLTMWHKKVVERERWTGRMRERGRIREKFHTCIRTRSIIKHASWIHHCMKTKAKITKLVLLTVQWWSLYHHCRKENKEILSFLQWSLPWESSQWS